MQLGRTAVDRDVGRELARWRRKRGEPRDVHRGVHFAQQMQVGMAHVNDQPVIDMPTCPFGGEKNSGIGRENGPEGVEHFTQQKSVLMPMGYTLEN